MDDSQPSTVVDEMLQTLVVAENMPRPAGLTTVTRIGVAARTQCVERGIEVRLAVSGAMLSTISPPRIPIGLDKVHRPSSVRRSADLPTSAIENNWTINADPVRAAVEDVDGELADPSPSLRTGEICPC